MSDIDGGLAADMRCKPKHGCTPARLSTSFHDEMLAATGATVVIQTNGCLTTVGRNMAKIPADVMPTMGSVKTHAKKIFAISPQSTARLPFAMPTLAWVVETGIPARVAMRTTMVAAKLTQKALGGVMGVILPPIVLMT